MKLVIMAGMALLAFTAYSFSSSRGEKETDFFAGVILLQSATALTAEQKATKYRELQKMTGITGARAKKLLAAYRDKPEEWQRVNGAISKLLSEQQPSLPASAGAPKPKTSP